MTPLNYLKQFTDNMDSGEVTVSSTLIVDEWAGCGMERRNAH